MSRKGHFLGGGTTLQPLCGEFVLRSRYRRVLQSIARAGLVLQTGKDALQPAGLPAKAESVAGKAVGAGAGNGSGCTEEGMACGADV